MAVKKWIGLGCKLALTPTTSGGSTSFVTVGGIISMPGPNASADDVDTTTLDNSTAAATYWKTYQRGQVDPGEMNVTLAYGSTDTGSVALGLALKDGVKRNFRVQFPSTVAATSEIFKGYVKGMGREIGGANSMITRTVTIKVSGNPGFKTT